MIPSCLTLILLIIRTEKLVYLIVYSLMFPLASIPEDAAEDQPGSTPQSLDDKQFLSRQVSDSAALSEVRSNGIKRSGENCCCRGV